MRGLFRHCEANVKIYLLRKPCSFRGAEGGCDRDRPGSTRTLQLDRYGRVG